MVRPEDALLQPLARVEECERAKRSAGGTQNRSAIASGGEEGREVRVEAIRVSVRGAAVVRAIIRRASICSTLLGAWRGRWGGEGEDLQFLGDRLELGEGAMGGEGDVCHVEGAEDSVVGCEERWVVLEVLYFIF